MIAVGDFIREQIVKRIGRSSGWSKARRNHLKKYPCCNVCGSMKNVSVHHKKPFHMHPELELDPDNLITLCYNATKCHFTFGHLGYWKSYNPDIQKDSIIYYAKIHTRPGRILASQLQIGDLVRIKRKVVYYHYRLTNRQDPGMLNFTHVTRPWFKDVAPGNLKHLGGNKFKEIT